MQHNFLRLTLLSTAVGTSLLGGPLSVVYSQSLKERSRISFQNVTFMFIQPWIKLKKNETVSEYNIPSSKPCRIGPVTENSSNYGTRLICFLQHLKTEAQSGSNTLCLVIIQQRIKSKNRRLFQNPGYLFSMTGSQNTSYTKHHKLGCYHPLEQSKIMLSLFCIFAYITYFNFYF